MTSELIIEGQHADLAPGTDITLEYNSGLFGEIGKLSLSHSYTIKLPRTTRNARIFDSPEVPAHDTTGARRYMRAEFRRNGLGLIPEAYLYLLNTAPDSYEVALVWDRLPGLTEWNDAKPKLTALSGLPTPTWKGAALATKNTTDGVFFARYNSGLWEWVANLPAAPHPSVTLYELVTRIFENAGIPYSISDTLQTELRKHALLVAPSHKPSPEMELESGAQAQRLQWLTNMSGGLSYWWFNDWRLGWDSPDTDERTMQMGATSELRIILNLKITGSTPSLYLTLSAGNNSVNLYPQKTTDGGYLIDTTVDLQDALGLESESSYYTLAVNGLTNGGSYNFSAYDSSLPLFALIRPHERISVEHQNVFPIADNLPEIGQMEFLKSTLALFGATMLAQDGQIQLVTYEEILKPAGALDWTAKVDMTEDGIQGLSYTLADFAQENWIRYQEDEALPELPDIELLMDDLTAKASRDMLKLPFAASNGDKAVHYRCQDVYEDGVYRTEAEDIDIKPRVFGFDYDSDGKRRLIFPTALSGTGAVRAYMQRYQDIIRKPYVLTTNIRLNDLDLMGLDYTRPVYLGQFGRYYAILKIQTSDTDLCKVELLQLP